MQRETRTVDLPEEFVSRVRTVLEEIEAPRHRWQVRELAVFGSALCEDFGTGSEVDALVRYRARTLGIVPMETELSEVFGRKVDLVHRSAIEYRRNHIRQRAILDSALVVHATR